MDNFKLFCNEIKVLLGENSITLNPSLLQKESENTLGIPRGIKAVLFASSLDQVKQIVSQANRFSVPLYPISGGKNLGYGDKIPPADNQVLLDLSGMNKIREFDRVQGKVVIEPGVTQQQLYDFLKDKEFCMDATGAGTDASIIGNTLEGGFGHTPLGNHRKEITGTEIVFGNGRLFQAGTFPGLGPDLNGLFVQSNFGIVTAMKIPLMRKPRCYESLLISLQEDRHLEFLIDTLGLLRENETLTSLVHVANATRSLISTRDCPLEFQGRIIRNDEAVRLMSSPLIKVGVWSAIGGLYGSAGQVAAKKKDIRKAFGTRARVRFFNTRGIRRIGNLLAGPLGGILGLRTRLGSGLASIRYIHDLGSGIPSNEALDHIQWKVKNRQDMGLIWYAPTFPATGSSARKVAMAAELLFHNFGFDFPLTMTLVEPDKIIGVLSISFNKNNPEEQERAHRLYGALHEQFEQEGLFPYRTSILGLSKVHFVEEGKEKTLKELKSLFDPKNIIAPGRYGISPSTLSKS